MATMLCVFGSSKARKYLRVLGVLFLCEANVMLALKNATVGTGFSLSSGLIRTIYRQCVPV